MNAAQWINRLAIIAVAVVAIPLGAATITLQQGVDGYTGVNDTYNVMNRDSTPSTMKVLDVQGYHCASCIDERTFIRFDLSGLDGGTTITSATLQLYCVAQPRPGSGTNSAYRVTKAWDQEFLNWTRASSTVLWTSVGGDAATSAVGTCSFTNALNVWHQYDVTSTVKGWIAAPATNFGLMIKMAPTMLTVHYNSSEAVSQTLRPKLVITTSATPVVRRGTVLRVSQARQEGPGVFTLNGAALGMDGIAAGRASAAQAMVRSGSHGVVVMPAMVR